MALLPLCVYKYGDVIDMNTVKVAAGMSFVLPAERMCPFLSESCSREVAVEQDVKPVSLVSSQCRGNTV